MELTNLIRETARSSADVLQQISDRGQFISDSFLLKADEIAKKDWLKEDILHSAEYGPLLKRLMVHKERPVLYIVEVANEIDHRTLSKAIRMYARSRNNRTFPAFEESRLNNEGHRVLYVGKALRDFGERVIQHMGYFRTGSTQGLQLAHWATAIGLDVKMTYYVFDPQMANLMASLESQVALSLRPLLGKHK